MWAIRILSLAPHEVDGWCGEASRHSATIRAAHHDCFEILPPPHGTAGFGYHAGAWRRVSSGHLSGGTGRFASASDQSSERFGTRERSGPRRWPNLDPVRHARPG
jgi:hypothetical protein